MSFDAFLDATSVDFEKKLKQHQGFDINIKERYELCAAFKAIFGGRQGKIVLEHLRERTIEKAAWIPPSQPGGEHGDRFGYFREGQNSIYRYVLDMIGEADRLKKIQQEAIKNE